MRLSRLVSFLPVAFFTVTICAGQSAPTVTKVEPPSWWRGSTVNPVRVLLRGTDLQDARVQSSSPALRIVGPPKVNAKGTNLFVDIAIAASAQLRTHELKVITSTGSTTASFQVLPSLSRTDNFQGFSPEDVVYLIMIDRFADGDTSNNDPAVSRGIYDRNNRFYYHGGDLQGVINHLPYLKELGVNALWLTPWYDNYNRPNEIELKEGRPSTGFHGYNPQDFYAVEEHFGTLEKLQELVRTAHVSGFKIIQDQVANHTGPYHPWVDDPPTPMWFNGTKEHHRKNVFQTWVLHDPRPVADLYLETMTGWFLDFLPDLNQENPDVERYLIQNTLWWIGVTGLDGIRMDTWQYVPNSFWQKWTRAVKREFPRLRVVGEVKDGDVVHTSFFQGGRVRFDGIDSGLDSLLDFPLFYPIRHSFAEGRNLDEVPKTLAKDYLYTNSEILMTLLGGHDDGRFMSEHGATIAGLKLANTFVLTTRGVPQLYYGDEIGMTGPDEPTTRQDFPGGFPGDQRNAFTREGRTQEQQEIFSHIQKLTALRRELEPLRKGQLVNLYVAEQQYAYARTTRTGVVVVAINNDSKSAEFTVNLMPVGFGSGQTLVDRLGLVPDVQVVERRMKINLPARAAAIFVRK
jgi:neopullulanase